ncbi:MAG TPA: hypothetical protein HA272_08100 [Methanoregula sp.]|nr:hypothetical protein [Methanoregula sp.]
MVPHRIHPPDPPPVLSDRARRTALVAFVLVLFFCISVAAAVTDAQSPAPLNRSFSTPTPTPAPVTTTPVPVRTAVPVTTATPVPVPTTVQAPPAYATPTPAPYGTIVPAATTAVQALRTTPARVICRSGQTVCNGTCTILSSDNENCGACGQRCPPEWGYSCRDGVCRKECAGTTGNGTEVSCSGQCTNLWWDNQNCGSCGNRCIAGETCVEGYCSRYCNDPSWGLTWYPVQDWTHDYSSPAFFRTQRFCGDCTRKCARHETCIDRQCTCPGDAAHAVCNGVCSDITSDTANCGTCGRACGPAQGCINGVCTDMCRGDEIYCNDHCTSRDSVLTCGSCNHNCFRLTGYETSLISPACVQGQCFAQCGQVRVSLDFDPQNCGRCGNICPAGQICVGGRCKTDPASCPTGYGLCDPEGSCIPLSGNPHHCGACGNACEGTEVCQNGMCRLYCDPPVSREKCWNASVMGWVCINPLTDPQNCGGCYNSAQGRVCDQYSVCSGGRCVRVSCPTGEILCGSLCVNTLNDRDNCGRCGLPCPWYWPFCIDGQCRLF